MIIDRRSARALIARHYPGMPFRITSSSTTIGVRPVSDPRPTLAWRALCAGSDSAVRIGIMRPTTDIDWSADVA